MSETKEGANPVDRFIGPRKILTASVSETIKTPLGGDVIEVVYDGGFKEVMTKKTFEVVVSDTASDYNKLRDLRVGSLIKEIMVVIREHDIKAGEIENLKIRLENELYNQFNRATHYLWSKDDASFVPGFNVVLDRSILEADEIIKTIPPRANEPKPENKPEGVSPENKG